MDGITTPPARSIAILDGRPEYARLLARLAAEDHRDVPIGRFEDLEAAQEWIEAASSPVVVLVDVSASDGALIQRALEWRARLGVILVAMFDERTDDDVQRAGAVAADATFAKPYSREMWEASFGMFLRGAVLSDRPAPSAAQSA